MNDEDDEIERAALRLARGFTYGAAYSPSVLFHSPAALESGDEGGPNVEQNEVLHVCSRGRLTEGAARNGKHTSSRVRGQHTWKAHSGILALPTIRPDPEALAALSFAKLARYELDLLTAYALEDISAWYRVEPVLMLAGACQTAMAARDAMSRLMYRCAETSMDDRAKQLRMRATIYREETRRAECVLRAWLLAAARKFNAVVTYRSPPIGASQGNGLRLSTFWNENDPALPKRKQRRAIGTEKHQPESLNSRGAEAPAKIQRGLELPERRSPAYFAASEMLISSGEESCKQMTNTPVP